MVALGSTSYLPISQEDGAENLPQGRGSPGLPVSRPAIYYNDGEFSPPSSTDDLTTTEKRSDRHAFLDDDDYADDRIRLSGMESGGRVGLRMRRASPLKVLIMALAALITISTLIGVLAARTYSGTAGRSPGRKHITMDDIFNGTFSVKRQSLHWIPEAGDGVFSVQTDGDIVLVDLKTGINRTLVSHVDVKDEHGHEISWSNWQLSSDMSYILLKTDHLKQWRHSSFGNYYVHDLKDHTTVPVTPPTNPPKIAYAAWSPTGNAISYVLENDLYIVRDAADLTTSIRVTTQGNSSLFHGVPDWVYEEEVFEGDHALWWSPDAQRVAFLRLDETNVEWFDYPVYNTGSDSFDVHPYPSRVAMRYPKPGYDNPLVSVHVFSLPTYDKALSHGETNDSSAVAEATSKLKWEGMLSSSNSIIDTVTWVANETLVLKEVTRAADDGNVVFFDLSKGGTGRVTRRQGEKGEEGDSGWIDQTQSIYPLTHPVSVASVGPTAYLDILPNKEGYNHIALFSPADSSIPRWLTAGDWEVTGRILRVDHVKGLVYFTGASKSGIERHIYSVPLPTVDGPPPTTAPSPSISPTPLTDVAQSGYYTASFSPQAGYYVLSHEGPSVPWQKVVHVTNSSFNYVLTDNQALNDTLLNFQSPVISHSTIMSDGYELNAVEIRPPGMDDSGRVRYPVLFRVYGGPGSQTVTTRFSRDWHDYLVCTLKYIVVVVDGRGTGFKGRNLRNPVRGNLGYYETLDQINAARLWATKRYVDSRRIGIWGWSYGGYMTTKVLEANAGIHTLGMAVAPVVSWRMYDSIYTERYMRTPQDNAAGYLNASVTNVEGFKHAQFLLAHGSGDDNVHFANSAHLLDMFTQAHVRDFRFRMFTDSDHSIRTRGAQRELYEWMTSFLVEKWGKGGIRRS
ncbi:hypothetical protein BS47DRAFT_1330979 [Hydnum rufescens UP504]|uniref:Dipeptidyl aminopeptidase n=1 Tax=Hydnum rufescens UP504 TaxID=1448309 RepID=A0A9P6ASV0_9AGAM|nr:hypothetical protein BS47DRAFT_1330979 [Hydnum rufescens UP504]